MTGGVTRRGFLIGGAELAVLASGAGTKAVASGSASVVPLETFDYQGVRLLPSRWQRQQDAVLSFYLGVSNDAYLKGFRQRRGFSAPGEDLLGWYRDGVFHVFGQIVSGLARFAMSTGRADVAGKVDALVQGFVDCVEPDGFFFYKRQPHAPHYEYEKVMCGLVDAFHYRGNQAARSAMARITGWAEAHLDRSRGYAYAGLPGEWYTLSENLYRAFLSTGEQRYRDFGRLWEYRGYWDRFYRGENWFQTPGGQPQWGYHAYSHVNTLSGLGAGYRMTGDPYYLQAMRNAYDMIRATQIYATGGYGPGEVFWSSREMLERQIRRMHKHFETQCGSWAVFKLVKYLLTATGDARYGDWAEQMLYNGVGASVMNTPDGSVQYFSDYNSHGGAKVTTDHAQWPCCAGTRIQAVADYSDLVFLRAPGELYVNLFLPATVGWARLETGFPQADTVRLTVGDTAPSTETAVKFRVPGWLSAPATMTVNGQSVTVTPDERNWIGVRRVWRAGDVIQVALPSTSRSVPFIPYRDQPAAIVNGPVVMAMSAADGALRPFYSYGPGERYYLYQDSRSPLRLHGAWSHNDTLDYSNSAGAYAEIAFQGTGVRLLWQEFDDAGRARVEIDGIERGVVDMYGPNRDVPACFEVVGLSDEPHTLRVTCLGQRQPASSNTFVNIVDVDPGLDYHGSWQHNHHFAFTQSSGAAVEAEFEGIGVRLLWQRFDDAGHARVEIDGIERGVVDMYGPTRDVPASTDFTGLTPGRHNLRVTRTGQKHPASAGTYINLVGLEPRY